jgi:hypothetical protein
MFLHLAAMSGTGSIPEEGARRVSYQWTSTKCLPRSRWSPHSDWSRAMTEFRLVPSAPEQIPKTGHFGTVSELKPSHTLHEPRR